MKYIGSKNRYAKYLLPIILKDRLPNQHYVEPFVGGANLIDKVQNPRIGSDIDENVIVLLKGIQQGFVPPDNVSEVEYKLAKSSSEVTALRSFIGFGCSYSSKWFGGYARSFTAKGEPRNHCLESKRNILKQKDGLLGVDFRHSHYKDLKIPPNSIIYCDPPYENTQGYIHAIDHNDFWEWCNMLVAKHHKLFVSEYNAPPEWVAVWKKTVYNSLTKDTGGKRGTECLFVHHSQSYIYDINSI